MAVTQKDIAVRLNLSRSVVAGVLGNQPATRVRDETRLRILQAAAEMNYLPNKAATALRKNRTGIATIAYVRPGEWRSVYYGVAENLAETLAQIRSSLMISVYPTQSECLDGLKYLASARVTDVVILLGRPDDIVEQGELLERHGLPFVILGRFEDVHPNWYQIDFDHEQMMSQSVQHLAEQGHKRIAYLGYRLDSHFCRHLLSGYRQAIERTPDTEFIEEYVGYVDPGAVLATLPDQVDRWWRLPENKRPTAIVVGTPTNIVWNGIELDLARRGLTLGQGPGCIAAAGLAGDNLALLNGSALVYSHLGHSDYARETAERLVVPILNGEDVQQRTVLVVPQMTKVQAYSR